MYRRPKFLEVLLEIRQSMSREADYDIDLFAEMVRSGNFRGDFDVGERDYEDEVSEADESLPTTKKEN